MAYHVTIVICLFIVQKTKEKIKPKKTDKEKIK